MENQDSTPLQDEEQTSITLTYEITYQPLPHDSLKLLPSHVQERVEELRHFSQSHPDEAIAPLRALVDTYPQVPVLYHYLQTAYGMTGQEEKAQALAQEAYQKHPDDLFAKTNYALLCLAKQKPDEIPIIFDGKFDLKLLYPQREVFHIDEFVAFSGVIALYYYAKNNRKDAEVYYQLLQEFGSDAHMTQIVHHHLYATFWQKIFYQVKSKFDVLEKAKKLVNPNHRQDYSKEF